MVRRTTHGVPCIRRFGIILIGYFSWEMLATACEVRLGGAIASSGKYTTYGENCVRGWTLWAEKLNVRGGFQLAGGNCKVRLPLDMRDDGSSKTKSAEVLTDMLNQSSASFANLDFVIGPASSGITLGNAAVARSFKKLLFSHGASQSLYNHNNTYIFSSLTPGRQYMASSLKLLWSKGAKSVVFAHESKSFSTSVCDGGNEIATALGMQVLGKFVYATGTTNFANVVYEIKLLNPDVYVGCGHLDDVTYLIGNANVLGVNPKAMIVTHASDERIIKNVGIPYSHGLLSPTQWDKSMDFADEDGFFGSAMKFHEDYSARFGVAPSYQAAYSAAMGYALQKAIENAGSISTEKVRTALQSLSIKSFYGPLDFSGIGDPSGLVGTMPNRRMVTTQIQNASIEVVAPEMAASASVLYPVPAWGTKALLLYPCALGYYEQGVSTDGKALCHACPAGHYRDSSLMSCSPCAFGRVANLSASSICSPCPAMTKPNARSGATTCVACSAGTYCPEGTDEPIDCPQGNFCPANQALPIPCPSGTYRNEEGGSDESGCFACEAGKYSTSVGTLECRSCYAGWFTPELGQRTCQRCPVGTYQDAEGSSSCRSCNVTFVTLFPSAVSADACVCGEGSFWNRAANACELCDFSDGVYCPWGNDIPLVKEGYYAELVGDPDAKPGSVSAFSAMRVWACPEPAATLCPGRDVLGKTNQSRLVGAGTCNRDCLSRLRLPNECPPHHRGVVCSLCEEGYGMTDGVCTECTFSGLSVFIISGTLAAFAIALLLYIVYGKPIPHSHTAKLLFASTCGQTVQFLQLVLVLWSFMRSSTTPSSLNALSSVFGFLLLDSLPMIQLDCLTHSDVQAQYVLRAVFPLAAASAFFTNWAVSRVLHVMTFKKTPLLSLDHTINVCGKVIVVVHVALCKLAVNCFACREQEAAPDTLVRYPSVLCDSSEHKNMLPIGWSAIFVYVFGILAVVIYICIRAPTKYLSDTSFRHRCNFLIMNWRPDRWYWGAVNMTRNALIALIVLAFPRSPFYQTCMMGILLVLCLALQVHFRPWQNERSNNMEACLMVSLVVFVFFSFRYLKTDPLDKESTLDVLFAAILVGLGCVSSVLIGHGFLLRINVDAVATKRNEGVAQLAERFMDLKALLGQESSEGLAKVLSKLPDADLKEFSHALSLLQIFHKQLETLPRKSPWGPAGSGGLNFNPAGSPVLSLSREDVTLWKGTMSESSAKDIDDHLASGTDDRHPSRSFQENATSQVKPVEERCSTLWL